MGSRILLEIAMDGDGEVKRKIKDVFDTAKRSEAGIGGKLPGGGRNTALAELQQQAAGLRAALAPLAEAGGIAGLLGGAGLGAILGRLATGPAGIVAGITAALVGMAKIGDESQRLKGRLSSAGDPKGFERQSERAKQLGTDVASLVPSYENFLAQQQKLNAANTSVIHPPGFQPGTLQEAAAGVKVLSGGQQVTPPSKDTFDKFDSALFSQIRRDVKSNEEARGITDDFKKSLFTGGLTPDLLRGLPPSARNFLTSQLSKPLAQGFENPEALATVLERRAKPLSATSVINAGAAPNEEFEKAARDARSFTQKAEALKASFGRLGDNAGGDEAGLGNLFDKGAQFIDSRNRKPPPLPNLAEFFGLYFNKNTPVPERPAYTPNALGGLAAQPATTPPPIPVTVEETSAFTDGRRYSRQLNPTPVADDVTEAGKSLAAAITEAANAVRNAASGNATQTVPGRAGGGGIDITPGGYLRGPGTTTSDSIPVAKVSNKEYVINAAGTAKAGLAYLDWINAGMPGRADGGPLGFADGGSPSSRSSSLGAGSFNVEATDDGGAIINGVKYGPGSPILEVPEIKQALARSRAQRGQDSKKTHKSDFVGIFGGHVFDTPGSYAKGGAIGRLPHFAAGGIMPDFSAGSAPSLSDDLAAPGGGSLGHMDVNLSTNWGDFKMKATPDVARAMAAAARDAADVQTGPRPSWYGRGK